jgi:hypothetical protein
MPRPDPVTQADHDRVAELHAKGLSRNAIAEATGRSGRTVSRIADQLGLNFERTRTAAATAAKVADGKARRAALAVALLDDAERLRTQLFAPTKAFNFGGKDNTYAETTLDQPTFSDQRNIMQAVATAVDRSVKLDEYDAGQDAGGSEVDRWLTGLTGG